MACGYATDSGLRRALRDFLDTNPKTLRLVGAFDTASAAFQKALDEARSAAPAASPFQGEEGAAGAAASLGSEHRTLLRA